MIHAALLATSATVSTIEAIQSRLWVRSALAISASWAKYEIFSMLYSFIKISFPAKITPKKGPVTLHNHAYSSKFYTFSTHDLYCLRTSENASEPIF